MCAEPKSVAIGMRIRVFVKHGQTAHRDPEQGESPILDRAVPADRSPGAGVVRRRRPKWGEHGFGIEMATLTGLPSGRKRDDSLRPRGSFFTNFRTPSLQEGREERIITLWRRGGFMVAQTLPDHGVRDVAASWSPRLPNWLCGGFRREGGPAPRREVRPESTSTGRSLPAAGTARGISPGKSFAWTLPVAAHGE